MTVRVLLADDQTLIREGFRSILERDPALVVVGDARDGVETLQLVRSARPDVVLMDIRMPRLDGIAATRAITADPALSSTRVLVITTYEMDADVFAALRAGASGFLLKDLEPDELRHAVHVVANGEALLAPSATRSLIARFVGDHPVDEPAVAPRSDPGVGAAGLTERERQVIALVARGFSNDEIAKRLVISPTTAKTHVSHAMIKLHARDRAQLVVFAYESGLAGRGA